MTDRSEDDRQRELVAAQAKLAAAQAELAALRAERDAARQVDTQGGLHVDGSVTARGDVIGRDYINIIHRTVSAEPDRDAVSTLVQKYLDNLITDLGTLRLGEIDGGAQDPRQETLRLSDVYVPLNVQPQIPEGMTLPAALELMKKRKPEPTLEGLLGRRRALKGPRLPVGQRVVTAMEAFRTHPRLTLLGRPGSGKSTFGHHIILSLAQAWRGAPRADDEQAPFWGEGPAPFPIMVVLRRFAEWLPNDRPAVAGDVWRYLESKLRDAAMVVTDNAFPYLQKIIEGEQGAVVFFDGLDECGEPHLRAQVKSVVDDFMKVQPANVRFLLTARPYAWPSEPDPLKGEYALADLNDDQVSTFIHAWYEALVLRKWISPQDAARKAEDLLAARGRSDLQPLAENPLLLTLMATLHANRGQLPDDRYNLYDESVELLLRRWNRAVGADKALLEALDLPSLKLDNLRTVLEELAFEVHREGANASPGTREGTADMGADRMRRAFRRVLDGSYDKADTVIRYIEQRAALVIAQGERNGEAQFTFPHRTFQEFLAACFLKDSVEYEEEWPKLAREAPDHWQVVLALAARGAKGRGASMAYRLIDGGPCSDPDTAEEGDWRCALLAGLMLQEIGVTALGQSNYSQRILENVRSWLVKALDRLPQDGGMRAAQRAQAGRVLASLGDPRFDRACYHLPKASDGMLGFVHLPANPEFRIGTSSARVASEKWPENERNDEVTPSTECYVSRYQVTVAQFRAYLDHTGLAPGDPDALRDPANAPVRWVSWHEALAYCRWLETRLREGACLDDLPLVRRIREEAWRVTLPSELEWEAAARAGALGTAYPWGDEFDAERANAEPTKLGGTCAVGCFPATGGGLYDMSGNVFEWTRSLWGDLREDAEFVYPYLTDDARREDLDAPNAMARVVRGGAFGLGPKHVRCAVRFRLLPDARLYVVGFRVVLSGAPVNSAL